MKKVLLAIVIVIVSFSIFAGGASEKVIDPISVVPTENSGLYKLEANPSRGYNVDAYLWIPDEIDKSVNRLLVTTNWYKDDVVESQEKVNSFVLNNFQEWGEFQVARELSVPYLFPAFGNTEVSFLLPDTNKQITELAYPMYLDRGSLFTKGMYKAPYLQITCMIKDALEYLKTIGIDLERKVLMTGYSGSCDFVLRYISLQPEIVHAVAIGGICTNGITLPIKTYNGHILPFPAGLYNVKENTGITFNQEAWEKIKIYLYDGKESTLDQQVEGSIDRGTPYFNCDYVYNAFGKGCTVPEMRILHKYSDNIETVVYDYRGHEEILNDVIEFLRKNTGEDFCQIIPTEDAVIYGQSKKDDIKINEDCTRVVVENNKDWGEVQLLLSENKSPRILVAKSFSNDYAGRIFHYERIENGNLIFANSGHPADHYILENAMEIPEYKLWITQR